MRYGEDYENIYLRRQFNNRADNQIKRDLIQVFFQYRFGGLMLFSSLTLINPNIINLNR